MTAIILAGGKSRRMGFNKAFLPYGDKTFIEHQIARLNKIFDEIILSANDARLYAHLNLPIVSDILPERGPLSGICAGLIRSTSFHSFVIACDMPFIHEKIILYLREQIGGYDVVVPQTSRGLEPLHAFYSRNCIQPMYRCLNEGRLRIIDFFSEVKVKIVDEQEFKELDVPTQPLVNLNTPEEYQKYCDYKAPNQRES
ncbi:MAG: molybdenum cofactor guanylyltransferase [Candidatus Brocadia sp. AMX2]|uniref:Probable molybdenum cofactor guanylyltransferase n=1 Tax=Candidatus Brocadia sinica JPN1 TaxID=1197129 RepID=A0ABQ0JYN9_9BACT|nr:MULTISPECIES: molybdenum cofactor guanylyltransferase [Brocadia]KXK24818.1 MAG: molybdopterin cofactor biosynthesis protein [Candidatus Brocadia sinica]MBC6933604.1 molybdenum cofactor guanylyltransferase [Candidatus Brocadia sp.]MBL1170446.1 molybdenum cofactor guanylyltransferase [Candidatus Brocadia sp. AMX1]NOG40322.1 molybdenum cofactor guanylyltransferase [Planctomycetota bacterium]KAA0241993.1 MAG: molybdenum cofactor guanylyltransferase [Candidatus Brocadia sp. AMX2]